jgi:uncharacterized protein
MRCSICQKEFQSESSDSLPFCSQRCRLIDLGRWLDEKYGMPIEPEEERKEPEDGKTGA